MRLIFWPGWSSNVGAGWAFPWEDVLTSSWSENSLELRHRNSNKQTKREREKKIQISWEGFRDKCCWWCHECREPTGGCLRALQFCFVCNFRPATALERSVLAVQELSLGLSALPVYPLSYTHRMASILHVLIFAKLPCSAVCKGRIYLICLKLTNPPVHGNKTNLRRGESSLSEMIRC